MVQVETYDALESLEAEIQPVDDESKSIIEEMGLEGQKGLVNEKGERSAYNVLTEQQRFVCMNLFPTYTKLNSYSVGPIPYRVLKEAKSAKEHFKELYVLHETPASIKDPVLVGANRDYYYWHEGARKYEGLSLIARWGEALESWDKLYKKAVTLFLQTSVQTFKVIESEVKRSIELFEQGVMPTNSTFNVQNIMNCLPHKL